MEIDDGQWDVWGVRRDPKPQGEGDIVKWTSLFLSADFSY